MHKIKTLFNTPEIMEPQKATIKVGKTPIEIALGIDNQGRTTAKRLYAFLELAQSQYARWCRSNITDNNFAEIGVDYEILDMNVENPLSGTNERNSTLMSNLPGKPKVGRGNTIDYLLTATFAKKLAMASSGVKGEQAREYFIKVEEQLKKVALSMETFRQESRVQQQENRVTLNEITLLNKMQAITRYSLGAASIQRVAAECGAVVHIGRRVLYHRQILDDYFEKMAE